MGEYDQSKIIRLDNPEERCNPKHNYVTFCVEYGTKICPKTCDYAQSQLEKKSEITLRV